MFDSKFKTRGRYRSKWAGPVLESFVSTEPLNGVTYLRYHDINTMALRQHRQFQGVYT